MLEALLIKLQAVGQVFSYEYCKISNNTFFIEHLWATAITVRSSPAEVFLGEGVLKICSKMAASENYL